MTYNNTNGVSSRAPQINKNNIQENKNPDIKNTTIKKPFKKKSFFKKKNNFGKRKSLGTHETAFKLKPAKNKNPNIIDDKIRILTIGGFEEVGRNMFAVESKDSIYIFDVGFQFTSEDETPGIDYTLPNIQYLAENKHKIKAIIITHGHLDHIGGIPFLMTELGNPPIYTRELTALLIKKRMEEFPHIPKIKINLVEPGDQIKIGDFSFEFFNVTHSIPDCIGISMKTKFGNIVISGDLKLAHKDGVPIEREQTTWSKVGSEKNVLMISDSTNCENSGWSIQEPLIHENVENYIKNAPSRIIIATFASQFERMFAFIRSAENLGKKIILEGRSIKSNMEIAKIAGYYTPKKDTVINVADIDKYGSDKIVIICSGGQGEEFAALPRMSRGDHKYVKLNNRDTVILSSSVIPGNELAVRNLKDQLLRHDVKLITYKTSDVHSTGHGNAEELGWILRKSKPTFFVPGYGYHSMLKEHKRIAVEIGNVEENNVIVPDNGTVIEISSPTDVKVLPFKVPSSPILVDGYSVSDIKKTVIADRKLLSKEGFVNIIVLINIGKRKLQKSPDILSRGFIYLRESQNLLSETRKLVTQLAEQEIENAGGGKIDIDKLKEKIYEKLELLFLQKTNKKPILIPVVLVV